LLILGGYFFQYFIFTGNVAGLTRASAGREGYGMFFCESCPALACGATVMPGRYNAFVILRVFFCVFPDYLDIKAHLYFLIKCRVFVVSILDLLWLYYG
jgi:hypothetical protein